MLSRLGKSPSGKVLERIIQSPNYVNGMFRNREKSTPDLKMKHPAKIFYEYFTTKRDVYPHGQIPVIKTSLENIHSENPQFLWLGHSTYFIFWKNINILIDPVISVNASPVLNTNIAFSGTTLYPVDDIPDLDYIILTHDHFDHLDFYSIKNLHNRTKKIICALGMEAHLIYWGIPEDKIISMDWDEQIVLEENLEITAMTTRHNSGRTLVRNQSLWNAYSLKTDKYNIFICGDGGYGKHFKENGRQYGPFDFGTIENGQYNMNWKKNHMFPEQAVQASIDLGIKTVVPIHWGRFALSLHTWNEPILRFTEEAEKKKINYCVPQIGQLYDITAPVCREKWWDFK